MLTRSIATLILCLCFGVTSSLSGTLKEIQAKGKLRVGVKDNLAPLGFYNSQGQLVGLEIDLAREIAREILGSSEAIEFYPMLNQDRLKALLEDKVDLLIADLTINQSRSRLVNFTDYYYLDGTGIITSDPMIEKLSDLLEKKIAVLKGSSAIAALKFYLSKDIKLVEVQSYLEGFEKLESKQVDAMVADRSILVGWRSDHPSYHLLEQRLSVAPLAIALPKGIAYNELQKRVAKVIQSAKQSGWLKQRITYWGLP